MLMAIILQHIGMIFMIKKIILSLIILQSCATAYDEIFVIVKNQALGYKEQPISVDDLKEAKFSFMMLQIGRNPEIRLVLNAINNGVYEWISADMHTIHTYNGLIVKSTGLPHNITLRDFRDFNPSSRKNFTATLKFDKPSLIGASLELQPGEYSSIQDTQIYTNLHSHSYSRKVSSIGWKSSDIYWVDGQNLTVFSKQEIHPSIPPIKVKYFYKY
jgi:hypothetical protein